MKLGTSSGVSENGVSINYSLARSLYNDHRSITAFNSFLESWFISSLFRCSNWTDHRFVRRSITLSPFESPWNAIWESSRETPSVRHDRGKSWRRTPRGMFVRLAAITGYPRRFYSIVYIDIDSPFHVPVFLVGKRKNAKMTSFHLQVLGEKGEQRALFNAILIFFVVRPESRSRISERAINIAQSSVDYTSMRYNV